MPMRIRHIVIVSALIGGMSAPARAQDFHAVVAKAAAQVSASRASEQATQQDQNRPIPKGYLYLGSGLFVGGLTAALVGFLNNSNGDFPEFGEATSTNVKMGAAGLATAFAGGAVLFLGKRNANPSTSVNFGPRQLTVSRRLSW